MAKAKPLKTEPKQQQQEEIDHAGIIENATKELIERFSNFLDVHLPGHGDKEALQIIRALNQLIHARIGEAGVGLAVALENHLSDVLIEQVTKSAVNSVAQKFSTPTDVRRIAKEAADAAVNDAIENFTTPDAADNPEDKDKGGKK